MKQFFREIAAVAAKEFYCEIRSPKFIVSQIALVFILIAALFTAFKTRTQDVKTVSAFFQVVFYAVICSNQLNSFSAEKENGTAGFWRQIFTPTGYICGKLLYNAVINYFFGIIITAGVFGLFYNYGFSVLLVFGFSAIAAAAFSACLTFPAVLCAGSAGKSGLFPFAAFPVALPAIISCEDILCGILQSPAGKIPVDDLIFVLSFSGVMAGVSMILYSAVLRYPEE